MLGIFDMVKKSEIIIIIISLTHIYKEPKSSSQISKTLKPYLILFFSKHGGSTIVAPLCVTRISLGGKSKIRTPHLLHYSFFNSLKTKLRMNDKSSEQFFPSGKTPTFMHLDAFLERIILKGGGICLFVFWIIWPWPSLRINLTSQ